MKPKLLSIIPFAALLSTAHGATVYNIDIDETGVTALESGYTRLASPRDAAGGSVTIDGDTFTLVGQRGARARAADNGSNGNIPLLRDFVFDEATGGGVELGLQLGGAGALEAGTWELSVYSWDSNVAVNGQIIGIYTDDGSVTEAIYGAAVDESSSGPAITFQFTSDGTSSYSLFMRDSASATSQALDKVRLNGIDLVLVPEPSSLSLLGLGGLLLLRRRR